MRELYASAVQVAYEKKKRIDILRRAEAMSGGRDIMKKVVEKQRTTKPKKRKKDYFTNGWGIVKKWQEKEQNKPPKETNPQTGDKFDVMQQVVKHPTPIKKQSLMAPLEKDPPKKRLRKKSY